MIFGQRRVFELHFEWDPIKAAGNRGRHRVSFDLATKHEQRQYEAGI